MKKYLLPIILAVAIVLFVFILLKINKVDLGLVKSQVLSALSGTDSKNYVSGTYRISPSRSATGVFRFQYEFLSQTSVDDTKYFDIAIATFDEAKARQEFGMADMEFGPIRDAWGYPRRENFFHMGAQLLNGATNTGTSTDTSRTQDPSVIDSGTRLERNIQSLNPFHVNEALASDDDPNIIGLVNCRANTSVTGYFKAYFEDVALNNNVGYDEPTLGQGRRDEACQVLEDTGILIGLNNTTVTPDILFMADPGNMPSNALAAASSYTGYYQTNPDNGSLHKHIITRIDPTPNVGDFDAFVITNFNGVVWDVDSPSNINAYDFYTVIHHEIMHTLGFRSLLPSTITQTNVSRTHGTFDFGLYKDANLVDKFFNNVTKLLQVPTGTPSPWFVTDTGSYRGIKNISNATPDGVRTVYTPTTWQQGSSLSHFDMTRAGTTYLMHPSLGKNLIRSLHNHEKEVLCHMGYQVQGLVDCEEETPIAVDDKLILSGTSTCVNLLANDSSFSGGTLSINSMTQNAIAPGDTITYYNGLSCGGGVVSNPVGARSFRIAQNSSSTIVRSLTYTNRDSVSNRVSYDAKVIMIVCNNDPSEHVCNGNFEMGSLLPIIRVPVFGSPNRYFLCEKPYGVFNPINIIPWWCSVSGSPDIVGKNLTTRTSHDPWNLPFPVTLVSPTPMSFTVDMVDTGSFSSVTVDNSKVLMDDPDYGQERITTKLNRPLVAGKEYEISFDVNPVFSIPNSNNYISSFNVLASVSQQFSTSSLVDIVNELVPTNKWTHIKKTFIANVAHEYLSLGLSVNSYINKTGVIGYIDNISIKEVAPADLCSNITGVQTTIPSGYTQGVNGVCDRVTVNTPAPPRTDLCPNLTGIQLTVPLGYTLNSSGQCTKLLSSLSPWSSLRDVCPNISGWQLRVPSGYQVNSSGDCVSTNATCLPPTATINPSTNKQVRPNESNIQIADINISNTSSCVYKIKHLMMSYAELRDPTGNAFASTLNRFLSNFINLGVYTYKKGATTVGQGTFWTGVSSSIPINDSINASSNTTWNVTAQMANVTGYAGYSFVPVAAYMISFENPQGQISNVTVTGTNARTAPVLTVVN